MSRGRITYESDDKAFPASAYTVDGYNGIAWRVCGWQVQPDEDTEWSGIMERTGAVVCIMVGDDRKWTFDPSEVHAIEESKYCHECGQIGCCANVYAEA